MAPVSVRFKSEGPGPLGTLFGQNRIIVLELNPGGPSCSGWQNRNPGIFQLGLSLPLLQVSIINISSGAGTGPVPGSGHYGAAKAGVNSLTLTLSAELAPNIRVNGVMPGAIPTEVMLTALKKTDDQLDELLEEWNIPLGRLGTPEDIGSACVYLASDAASWISGEILRVGGGAKPR